MKLLCDEQPKLPIAFLQSENYLTGDRKHGAINWFQNGVHVASIRLSYDSETWQLRCVYGDYDYEVSIGYTQCNYGGWRPWLCCPICYSGIPCRRKAKALYLVGGILGCRKCHNLAYASQYDKPSRMMGYIGEAIDLERKIEEAEDGIRIRYWKGRPTKRYRTILKKYEKMDVLMQPFLDKIVADIR